MGNRYRWLIGLVVIALVAIVGVYAYNAGVAQGLVQSGRLGSPPGAVGPVVGWYPRPWGYGFFPFFPIIPLFFILFWALLIRGLFWRRGSWYRGYGYGPGCGG